MNELTVAEAMQNLDTLLKVLDSDWGIPADLNINDLLNIDKMKNSFSLRVITKAISIMKILNEEKGVDSIVQIQILLLCLKLEIVSCPLIERDKKV